MTDGNELVTYHVTDDPSAVKAILRRRGRLMSAYGAKGRTAELGPGLYVSGSPSFWMNRARGKWSFLVGLQPASLAKLATALRADLHRSRERQMISQRELENALRDIGNVESGMLPATYLSSLAGQPTSIAFWQPEFLRPLGIKPGDAPQVLEVRVRGQLAELRRSSPDPSLLRALRRSGIVGAYTRAGMSSNPELVIWDSRAVTSVRDDTD